VELEVGESDNVMASSLVTDLMESSHDAVELCSDIVILLLGCTRELLREFVNSY
jgi:hypothetical protein